MLAINRKHTLNCHRMKPALFNVLCEIKEKTGKDFLTFSSRQMSHYKHKSNEGAPRSHDLVSKPLVSLDAICNDCKICEYGRSTFGVIVCTYEWLLVLALRALFVSWSLSFHVWQPLVLFDCLTYVVQKHISERL